MVATFARAWKPWFVYRPGQLFRRLATGAPSAGFSPVHAAWGATLLVDPTRDIGRSLLTTSVFDLAVSEAIARLLPPGGTFVDAGANIGYMSVLAARVAGAGGHILSFEPHPQLAGILQRNADAVRSAASITVHPVALGRRVGQAELLVPADFGRNDGIARLLADGSPVDGKAGRTVPVQVTTLDTVLDGRRVDVLKLDVEGFEAQVLAGARASLAARRIRHVIFEDHDVRDSEAVAALRAAGYSLFALGWTLRRLRIEPLEGQSVAHAYEAPSFIATVDAAHLGAVCAPAGWRTLRPLR